jgi:hypothetical protein
MLSLISFDVNGAVTSTNAGLWWIDSQELEGLTPKSPGDAQEALRRYVCQGYDGYDHDGDEIALAMIERGEPRGTGWLITTDESEQMVFELVEHWHMDDHEANNKANGWIAADTSTEELETVLLTGVPGIETDETEEDEEDEEEEDEEEEDEEDEDDEDEDRPSDEDYTLTTCGSLGGMIGVKVIGGRFLGQFAEQDDAEEFIRDRMNKQKFWPNVWWVSDHGNWNCITARVMSGGKS